MQFLASVGNAFLLYIGATTLTKMCASPFYQTGCGIIEWDIRYPIFCITTTSFLDT